ncbi:nicotinate-nucleotide adenylyltransferase [Candidatus Halobeggiatoa sp. HSG11]|nr:nicotinate-nucleotide adenylyltransferase [Candidatus Halobeggiatoa sp. HSG11]
MNNKIIGIFGGTFNPIHHGHLRLAIELYERLDLAQVRFIPAASPPHKQQPCVTGQQRLQMVQAAINGIQGLTVDARELQRTGLSYTIDTLNSFRKDYLTSPLGLILGMDAFLSLPSWHKWEELINLTHFIVVGREQFDLSTSNMMHIFLRKHQTDNLKDLTSQIAGKIWIQDIPTLNISATQIRAIIATGKNPNYLLPTAVLNIINAQQFYSNS